MRRPSSEAGFDLDFVQDNHSRSARGTLRGMHFQTRAHPGQAGAGDLRRGVRRGGGPAPLLAHPGAVVLGVWLSADNHHHAVGAAGLRPRLLVTSEYADFQYKCTDIYHPASEVSLAWDDPTVGIDWPLPGVNAAAVREGCQGRRLG